LFSTLPDTTLEKVAAMSSEKHHAQGKTIVREGGRAHAFHLIVEGEADVTADGTHLARLGPGDHFGEIAIVEDAKRNATVTAVTPVRVLAIDTVSFRRLARSDASLAAALPPAIAERLSDRDQKLTD
jgi:CRP-like cAMP-binding protein